MVAVMLRVRSTNNIQLADLCSKVKPNLGLLHEVDNERPVNPEQAVPDSGCLL